MAKFTFLVDRLHQVVAPIALETTLKAGGETVTLSPGETVVYRGVIELGGVPHYTFDHQARKLFTRDRAQLENALEERYDELLQV